MDASLPAARDRRGGNPALELAELTSRGRRDRPRRRRGGSRWLRRGARARAATPRVVATRRRDRRARGRPRRSGAVGAHGDGVRRPRAAPWRRRCSRAPATSTARASAPRCDARRGVRAARVVALLRACRARGRRGRAPPALRRRRRALSGSCPRRWLRFEARLAHGNVKAAISATPSTSKLGPAARPVTTVSSRGATLSRRRGSSVTRGGSSSEHSATSRTTRGDRGARPRAARIRARRIAPRRCSSAPCLGRRRGRAEVDALVDLAKILAKMGDLPQAIARVRQVTAPSARFVEARALEAAMAREAR